MSSKEQMIVLMSKNILTSMPGSIKILKNALKYVEIYVFDNDPLCPVGCGRGAWF